MSAKRPDSICQNCGKAYHPKSTGRLTYCSRECYFASGKVGRRKTRPIEPKKERSCKVCGKVMEKCGVYCGDECEREQRRREEFKRNKSKKVLKERPCCECGKLFVPEYGNKRRFFCSDICLRRKLRRQLRQKVRARLKTVSVENVVAIKVFMRDGWRCQLCGIRLKSKDRGTFKDFAPELDHIIPLSKGGEHSYRNTQCACRKCNSEKGANEVGQLRMFG
jgi:5-methylcytosine-specific restriction endonuclease McrA